MRQLFTMPLANNDKDTIDRAKKDMAECAQQMGFNNTHEFKVQRIDEGGKQGWRMDAVFYAG